jgi:anti-sigma factor RsiW
MTCRELIEFLIDYLDGTLAPQERERFDAHLAVCAPCKRYLDSYRKTIRLAKSAVATMDVPRIPEELVHAILASRR